VFVDSRARAETLATSLRQLDVTTFVTHSSLSQEQRHQAEEAFATRDDCVIVATSVLELGVDVGDLDRVIQIDASPTVASFLQRMGRTGRRSGILRNCLFLATKNQSLIQAAALIDLWNDGYVEPIEPPAEPYHILAQQLMALALQTRGVGRRDWFDWVKGSSGFSVLPRDRVEHLVEWMLAENILWDDEGILWLGTKGQEDYGRRNFMELFSVFMSPPLFSVLNGRRELGYVDEMTFLGKCDGPRVLLLGGRAWKVNHIDWQRRIAYVELSDSPGRTRWKGGGQGLSFAMCQSIKRVLAADDARDCWSKRAIDHINESRLEFPWLHDESTIIVTEADGGLKWWNFAGSRANATLANEFAQLVHEHVAHDSFTLKFESSTEVSQVESALNEIQSRPASELWPAIDERAIDGLKFSDCLPHDTAIRMLSNRMRDGNAIREVSSQAFRSVS
jgi:ATP-dependent Lhr-like helicase